MSGGGDSLALLLLAHASLPPGSIEAATVDHGLRPQSATEAAFVSEICEGFGIPHETLKVTLAKGNLQGEARRARYGALEEWARRRGLVAIATAHHADDQAETLVMRLNRGSGVAGLAGIRPRGVGPPGGLALVRPLLDWRREELAQIARQAGLDPVEDPSNKDPRFDRARIRQSLAGCDWLSVSGLAQSARHVADAQAALEWASEREWAEQVTTGEQELAYTPCAPRAIRLLVLARILGHFGGSARGGELARLLDCLESGHGGTLGGVVAQLRQGRWQFRRENPRTDRTVPKGG